MTKNDNFALLMKFLRERAGLSARQLSLDAGLSASYVSKIESGVVLPTISSFAHIIQKLDVSPFEVSYLLQTLVKDKE